MQVLQTNITQKLNSMNIGQLYYVECLQGCLRTDKVVFGGQERSKRFCPKLALFLLLLSLFLILFIFSRLNHNFPSPFPFPRPELSSTPDPFREPQFPNNG